MVVTPSAVLLPYQAEWHNDRARVRVAEKSRRIGFSWSTAAECALDASEIDGCDAWYVGYNKQMAEEFIRDVAFWAKKFSISVESIKEEYILDGDDPDKAILTYVIRFASGFRVTALSSRPTNLRGKRGHIIIDEAAYHEDLPGLLKAAMAVLIWGGRARVSVISTHNGVDNDFNKLVEDVKAKRKPYSLHTVDFKEAVRQGLVKRICLVNGTKWSAAYQKQWVADRYAEYGDDAKEELDCIPSKSGGTYITRPLIERAMIDGPIFRLSLPDEFLAQSEESRRDEVALWCDAMLPALRQLDKTKMHFFGEDFGRVSDLSAITPGYLTQDLKRRFPFAVEMKNVPYKQQEQVLFFVVDRLPNFFAGALDATGNGGYLAEVATQRYGADRIASIALSELWYSVNLPQFKSAFEEQLIEVVRDADHLVDLTSFKVINGIPKLPKAKTKTKSKTKDRSNEMRHGDAAIAYLLGFFASQMPFREYAYESAKVDKTKKAGFGKWSRGVM